MRASILCTLLMVSAAWAAEPVVGTWVLVRQEMNGEKTNFEPLTLRIGQSGDKLAFVAVDGETRRLFIRKVGGDALLVNTVGSGKVRDLEWAGIAL